MTGRGTPSRTETARSRPPTWRSSRTFESYANAATSAGAISSAVPANLMPRADPPRAGLTTIGNPSSRSISGMASAAPRSRKADCVKAWNAGVGMPASHRRCFATTLSQQRAQAAGPDPVYGIPSGSSSSWTVPSSPASPWSATNATSGRASRRRGVRSAPTSMATTSWPRRSSASSTREPEFSETERSKERPPLSTATRVMRGDPPPSRAAPGGVVTAPQRDHVRSGWPVAAPRRLVGPGAAGQGTVEAQLLAYDLADAPDALTDRVLVDARVVEPHRGSAAAVDERPAAGDERDVVAQCSRQEVRGVEVLREGRPDEQASLWSGEGRLGRQMFGQ